MTSHQQSCKFDCLMYRMFFITETKKSMENPTGPIITDNNFSVLKDIVGVDLRNSFNSRLGIS